MIIVIMWYQSVQLQTILFRLIRPRFKSSLSDCGFLSNEIHQPQRIQRGSG